MSYPKEKQETYAVDGGINTKISKYTTERNELLRLTNMNFSVVDALTKRPGTTLYLSATIAGRIGGLYEFERLNGASYLIATANTNAYTVTAGFNSFKTGLLNNGIFDFVTFVDRLFMANGQDFFKYDGTNAQPFSLPKGISHASFSITAGFNAAAGLSGVYIAGYGYLNDRGYYGPPSDGVTLSLNGVSYNALFFVGMTTPANFGISAIALYRSEAGFGTMYGTTNIAISTATFLDWSSLSNREQPDYIHFTLAPRYMEIFNNQLMMAGFSSALSTLYWSDIGEPEGVRAESFAEVRTNDGDRLTGLRAYFNDLIISKERSLHRLSGDNPDAFTLQQITDQFGCLSNRTMIVYNNNMLFLDSKGIMRWNGAGVDDISTRIEDIFARMNVSAARENAVGFHNRLNNEVWIAIPIDGSTTNNLIIVYDYLTDSFAFYDGPVPSTLALVQGRLEAKTPLYGGYTGTIAYFDDDVENDLGAGFTCLIQHRFLSNYGQSIEQQFRRFYLNIEPIAGSSHPINLKFFTDYGSTVMASFTIYQERFQTRVDFGIPAKTLSTEISHYSASLSFRVFGWTVESRFQRPV
jgi:hypothetical protein